MLLVNPIAHRPRPSHFAMAMQRVKDVECAPRYRAEAVHHVLGLTVNHVPICTATARHPTTSGKVIVVSQKATTAVRASSRGAVTARARAQPTNAMRAPRTAPGGERSAALGQRVASVASVLTR